MKCEIKEEQVFSVLSNGHVWFVFYSHVLQAFESLCSTQVQTLLI